MTERMSPQQRLVVAIAVLGSFVAFLDGTVVNVALPAIARELGGGLSTQQWTVDSYLVTLGALILVAGAASDAYGRLLVLRIGLIGFGVASLAVAAAPTIELLIAARALQGVAGAFLVPSSLALITSTMSDPAHSRAIGLWTALTTSAMIVGPLIGGVIVDFSSWRFVFVINVLPIGLALWLLTRLDARDQRRPDARIDWLGAALCTVGLGLAVLALIELPVAADPMLLWIALVAGIALFAGFLWRQHAASVPLLPLSLFRSATFANGNIATFFIYAALSLNGFIVAVYLQQGAGLTATLAGLASLPTTILTIALSSRIGALSGRIGPRLFMTVGPVVMAIGCLLLLTVGDDFDYWWQVLPGMVVLGLGLAITVSPLTAGILGSVDPERSGIASAVNNAVARVAGLFAVAGVAAITGGALDLAGFHRASWTAGALLIAGAIVSAIGVRNPPRERLDAEAQPDAAP
ncbi:MFS transporter [Microbacterium telephonicum]|uniref:EmrB/QacA subfamily drug resistance transporter n=1 Tax=Microbacterium telephonicum TaxID=1714841 RepID=A0A498BTK3_9MICO|nr:MFS transporter [Microbacterium telephonicum]RLK46742.1 EmrB/QacA subfamily drug resistance transporter [Microbacterium telephonicum]